MTCFADVLLPLPIASYFTYRVPEEMASSLQPGSRVIVPFGRKKYYTAIVVFVHGTAPRGYETKEILSLLDEQPVLRRPQLKFWEWMAGYYLCTVGDVYKAALPAGLKLESETEICYNPAYEEDETDRLSEREALLLGFLAERGRLSIVRLERESGLRNILPAVRGLLEKEAVSVSEQIRANYRPKTERYVRAVLPPERKEELKGIFDALKGAPKQLQLLMAYLELSGFMRPGSLREVSKKRLLEKADVTPAVLNALVEKGILECYLKTISRLERSDEPTEPGHPLNEIQQQAYADIKAGFREKAVTLLHGVTASGKTEIYIRLIEEVLKQGRQVLYLVPEIALTTQLTVRLQRVFGNSLAIYHSKFTDNERVEIWNKLLHDREIRVVLGVRSSLFLPFRDLGLVIVDEEHETSYKQQEPAPRYHARNAAIVLAGMHGAKTLLGTATPAVETYYNAQTGKYGYVAVRQRYENIALPEILPVDAQALRRKKQMQGPFSPLLLQKSREALLNGEQVILFQNRRGYAPMIECGLCAWVPKCIHCDVSLTYHKREHRLTCHYCGYSCEVPRLCPACGSPAIESRGFGTERVEDDVATVFPEATVARMDSDTVRTRRAHEKLIDDFQQRKSQVLIGTQMVTKGLDFDNVRIVGILNADALMNLPDFRAHERAFQLMAQVAGRAGRKGKRGTVVLQTAQPEHPLIAQIVANDYEAMYRTQLEERKRFRYPPFYRLIYIYLKHRDEATLNQLAQTYAEYLRQTFGERILGPDNPPVARIQALFIRKIVLKTEPQASLPKVKQILLEAAARLAADERFRSLLLYYDVDPL